MTIEKKVSVRDLVFGALAIQHRALTVAELIDLLRGPLAELGIAEAKLPAAVKAPLVASWQKGALLKRVAENDEDAAYGLPRDLPDGLAYVDRRKQQMLEAVRYLWLQQSVYLRRFCTRENIDHAKLTQKLGEALRYALDQAETEYGRTLLTDDILPAVVVGDLDGLPELPT